MMLWHGFCNLVQKKKINMFFVTEKRLKSIIAECVSQIINERLELSEMSIPRKEYKERIESLSQQLLENWCLVRWCRNANLKTHPLRNHWAKELRTHLIAMANLNMKDGDYAKRLKLVREIWKERDFADAYTVRLIVSGKFDDEQIDRNSEAFQNTTEECAHAANDITMLIALRDYDRIRHYIEKL